jgi:hypothetical protein
MWKELNKERIFDSPGAPGEEEEEETTDDDDDVSALKCDGFLLELFFLSQQPWFFYCRLTG